MADIGTNIASEYVLPVIGWALIPSLATRIVQTTYYSVFKGSRRPVLGSARWVKHNRRIHIALILAYLLYNIYDAYNAMRRHGDFYEVLGVDHDIGEKGIKSRFRKLAAIHHPDKISATEEPGISDAYFVQLRLAQDTLLKPAQRFAYDRFGPTVLAWEHCSSIRDYVTAAFTSAAPGYIGTAIITVMFGVIGVIRGGSFWRYYTGAALILLEIYTATRPFAPPFLVKIINTFLTWTLKQPPLLPFQMLILARKITITIVIAISQLGPYFKTLGPTRPPDSINHARLLRLEQIAGAHEIEATRLLQLDMAPYERDVKSVKQLKECIREWLVQNTIRADPAVRETVGNSLKER